MSPDLNLFNHVIRSVRQDGVRSVPHDVVSILAYMAGVSATFESTYTPPFNMARFEAFVRNQYQAHAPWGTGRIVPLVELFRADAKSEDQAIDNLWNSLAAFMAMTQGQGDAGAPPLTAGKPGPSSDQIVDALFRGAAEHGDSVEHAEADDLIVFFGRAWETLTDEQRAMFVASPDVRNTITASDYYSELCGLLGIEYGKDA